MLDQVILAAPAGRRNEIRQNRLAAMPPQTRKMAMLAGLVRRIGVVQGERDCNPVLPANMVIERKGYVIKWLALQIVLLGGAILTFTLPCTSAWASAGGGALHVPSQALGKTFG